jgi:hypothetical protein
MKFIILNPKAAKQISAGEISYISSPRGKSMKNHPFSFYAKASVYYPQNRPLLKTRSRNHNFAVNHPFLLGGVNELSSRVRKAAPFFFTEPSHASK